MIEGREGRWKRESECGMISPRVAALALLTHHAYTNECTVREGRDTREVENG